MSFPLGFGRASAAPRCRYNLPQADFRWLLPLLDQAATCWPGLAGTCYRSPTSQSHRGLLREDDMRARLLGFALTALLIGGWAAPAAAQTRTTLDIYVIDVEGGNATLLVPPSGESVLIDSGNVAREAAIRDAERIMAAVKDAGLTQIDHLITTHWHNDHFGAMAELAKRVPIRHFIDHGPTVQPNPIIDEFLGKTYPALYGNAKLTIAKA